MVESIARKLQAWGILSWHIDASLSSGERAQAEIVESLSQWWDKLDGAQQRAFVDVLDESAKETEAAEEAGLKLLGVNKTTL